MSKKVKKKLCWNCEGESSFQDESCSYCGVSLTPLSIGDDKENPLTPPYRLVNEAENVNHIPISPYKSQNPAHEGPKTLLQNEPSSQETAAEQSLSDDFKDDLKITLLTVFLLFSGSVLLIFGLMILLFSENGHFILKWSDQYWVLYFVFALPMLFFGWMFLKKLEN